MILKNALREYLSNFKIALSFGILLFFVAVLSFLSNTYVGSGSLFLEYNLLGFSISYIALELVFMALFLLAFSFFITLIIFAVRKDLSHVRVEYYLGEMIKKFTTKIFIFYALLATILLVASSALISIGIPLLVVNFAMLLITLALSFVPQSIVVDEGEIDQAITTSLEFIEKNFSKFATVVAAAIALLAVMQMLEFFIDYFYLVGRYVSLVITLIFILPFIEILKTYLYMFKFELIKSHEMMGHKKRS